VAYLKVLTPHSPLDTEESQENHVQNGRHIGRDLNRVMFRIQSFIQSNCL